MVSQCIQIEYKSKNSVYPYLVPFLSRTMYLVPVRDHRYEIGASKRLKSHYSNQPPSIAPSRLMKSEGNWAALYTVAGGERCATKRGSSPLGTRLSVRDCLYEIVGTRDLRRGIFHFGSEETIAYYNHGHSTGYLACARVPRLFRSRAGF
ncbi:hypothetical protein OUZ56_032900 [Daphnia magna]|uniref:Uncharacterized protein n=1 Tax=Daphnia magna TaxID=35525 RepID=A0ABR0B9V8_9CRUS|nr:hypothetical protein OUZ56_032900 [Daphnia magna]